MAKITHPVPDRRSVHLNDLDDLTSEIDRVESAAASGQIHPLANWSPAQVLQHIGRLIEFSFDGFPFRYPWHQRLICRLIRLISYRLLLRLAFRPGFRNPPQAAALEPDPAVSLADASAYLKRQVERIRRGEQMTQRSPAEGPVTHAQWVEAHLRHAELHLSFLAIS